ncbi:MAG: hypothetical protein V1820_02780 [archaeon]
MEERKQKILIGILAGILLVGIIRGATNWNYAYWPAIAGAFSIPLLLAALFVDNINFSRTREKHEGKAE